jgi:hypothetical protein
VVCVVQQVQLTSSGSVALNPRGARGAIDFICHSAELIIGNYW